MKHLDEIERVFLDVLDLPLAERPARLDALCAGDSGLRARVESLLMAQENSGDFLGRTLPECLAADFTADTVAQWQLVERIGEGGLGVVYRACAEQDGVQLTAAVKILRPGFDDAAFRRRFVQERQILASLDHPHIARLLDAGISAAGVSYMAMQFVDGRPIDRHLAESSPSLHSRIGLFTQVCEAVLYLHSRFIAHGDIKPSNVMVTAEGSVKLLDFGAARVLSSRPSGQGGELTRLLLTPHFASPEQRRGDGPSLLGDIFSLGRLLEFLTASLPANADLSAIQQRCLDDSPAHRYQSAAELLEDLRRWRERLPVRARPATVLYFASRFLRRRWPVAALAAALFASVLTGWIVSSRNAQRADLRAAQYRDLVTTLFDTRDASGQTAGDQADLLEKALERSIPALHNIRSLPEAQLALAHQRLAFIQARRGVFAPAFENIAHALAFNRRALSPSASADDRTRYLVSRFYEVLLHRHRGEAALARKLALPAMELFLRHTTSIRAPLEKLSWVQSVRLLAAEQLLQLGRTAEARQWLAEAVHRSHPAFVNQRDAALISLIRDFQAHGPASEAERYCQFALLHKVQRAQRLCAPPASSPAPKGLLVGEQLTALLSRIQTLRETVVKEPHRFRARTRLLKAQLRYAAHLRASGQAAQESALRAQVKAEAHKLQQQDPENPILARILSVGSGKARSPAPPTPLATR